MSSREMSTQERLAETMAPDEALGPVQTSPTSPGPASLASPQSGELRYGESEQLGAGGMGEVRLARDRRIGRRVALKRMHPHVSGEQSLLRFMREARIQGQLEHPSIAPVYDLGVDPDGSMFFTMRRIRGRTLEQVLRLLRGGHEATAAQYTRRKLLTMFSTVCLTVQYAHQRGVLHRDLKPANVMVGEFGEVYVLDWGIAKVLASDEAEEEAIQASPGAVPATVGATQAGAVMGTLGYMPPEQLRGDIQRLDARSDVYALGMILFELLTFERVFEEEAAGVIFQRTLEGLAVLPSQRAEDVPPELDELFRRATALDPGARFASARELSDAVEHFLDGDRDLHRRRELAHAHAERAERSATAALAAGGAAAQAAEERVQALHEITSALALDPQQQQARATLHRLLTELPRELPPAVRTKMDRSTQDAQMNGLRFGSIIYLSWIGIIAFVLFMGVRSWAAFAVPTTGVALILLHTARVFARGAMSTSDARLLGALTFGTIAAFSVWLGPFVLVPLATSCGALVFSIQAAREERWYYLTIATLASLAPFLIEFTGLFPPAYDFRPEGLLLLPRAVQFSPTWTLVGLIYLSASFTFVPAYYLGRVRDSLASAEQQLFLHAWHFEQLTATPLPGAPRPSPERAPALPS